MVETLPASGLHAERLAPLLTPADVAEVLAASGHTPLEALHDALVASEQAYTLFINGEVAAMYGVAPVRDAPHVGVPWLLCGLAARRHPRVLARLARPALDQLQAHYPTLLQAVDARYQGALRFVRWLGFTVGPAAPFGHAQLPFHMIRRDACAPPP